MAEALVSPDGGAAGRAPLRTLLICHHDAELHREGITRWLASFSTLAGVVVIHEDAGVLRRRVKRELQRSGVLGFLDVLAFRAYYAARLAAKDDAWTAAKLDELRRRFPAPAAPPPELVVRSPNSAESEAFIREARPDIIIALCKNILAARIFELARAGTFVFHPGICPEYRNAHGCFWALTRRDLDRVGMTVLRIDRGVDTGPVFGYFTCDYDEVGESHAVIQARMTLDNLDAIRDLLRQIAEGRAATIDTTGRESAVWGQPRLTSYLRWKRAARAAGARHGAARENPAQARVP